MITEYKYYLEKINRLLTDEEINNLIISYINTGNNIEDDYKSDFEKNENKKNILKFISNNTNTVFSKNYIQNKLNNLNDIELRQELIMNRDLQCQRNSFKEKLKIKSNKRDISLINEVEKPLVEQPYVKISINDIVSQNKSSKVNEKINLLFFYI